MATWKCTQIGRDWGQAMGKDIDEAIDRLEPAFYKPGTVRECMSGNQPFELASCSFVYRFEQAEE